jgi:hypothetical protein
VVDDYLLAVSVSWLPALLRGGGGLCHKQGGLFDIVVETGAWTLILGGVVGLPQLTWHKIQQLHKCQVGDDLGTCKQWSW